MPNIISKFLLTLLCLPLIQNGALCQTTETTKIAGEDSTAKILNLAASIGMEDDFRYLNEDRSDKIKTTLAEARTLKHLWQTEFELKRILTEIDEERTALTLAIERIENRQTIVANSLDSVNFLSTSIIALVGNCIFIPAPPPRPKIPNILFSTANGISTGMSVLSLAALQGGQATIDTGRESMLAPLFAADFSPEHSGRVWNFLNFSRSAEGQSTRQKLLAAWTAEGIIPAASPQVEKEIVQLYGLGAESGKIKLSKLRLRRRMLEELQYELLSMSHTLADLGRCL